MHARSSWRYQPVKVFTGVSPGQKLVYDRRELLVTETGLQLNGSGDTDFLRFHIANAFGPGSNCFAFRQADRVLIFRGSGLGMGMIDEQVLRRQLGV